MGYLLLSPSPSPPLAFQYPSAAFGGAACPGRGRGRSRARRGAASVVASSASTPDGGPSTSAADAYVLARRVVLLGASAAVPLFRLREAAAATTTVYGSLLSEGFIRRKGIDAPRVNHEAENCYKTFKNGRNSTICRPEDDEFDEMKDVSKFDDPQSEGTKGIPKPDNLQLEVTNAETTTTEARQPESSLQSIEEQPPGNPLLGFLNTVAVAASGVLGGLYGTSLQEKKALQSIISSVNHLQTCS